MASIRALKGKISYVRTQGTTQSHTSKQTTQQIHCKAKPRRVAASAQVRCRRKLSKRQGFYIYIQHFLEVELSRVKISRVRIDYSVEQSLTACVWQGWVWSLWQLTVYSGQRLAFGGPQQWALTTHMPPVAYEKTNLNMFIITLCK